MGLPLRIAMPILVAAAIVFIAVMGALLRIGLGTPGTALGTTPSGGAHAVATPAAAFASEPPGTFAIPQSGTGRSAANALPGQLVGGGAPPAPVQAMLSDLKGRIARDPHDAGALIALGNLYADAAKDDEAGGYYRRALDALDRRLRDHPDDRAAQEQRAVVVRALARYPGSPGPSSTEPRTR